MLNFINSEFTWHSLLVNFSGVNFAHCNVGEWADIQLLAYRLAKAALCVLPEARISFV